MKLIVGLGNPGKEYENTRHNIGFMCLNNYLGSVKWSKDSYGDVYKEKYNDDTVIFLKPTTFMNLSGNAVKYYKDYYKLDLKDILVIQDDLDLPVGAIRIKKSSSAGGHNGIKDIINKLGTNDFLRLKIGISKSDDNIIDYVLGKLSKTEILTLNETFNKSEEIIKDFINNIDDNELMNRYN